MNILDMWLSEALALVSTIDPQTVANSEKIGDYVDMADYHEIIAIFSLGNMAAETIDCRLQEALTSAGGSAQAAKSATQLAAHASNNDNTQIIISLKSEDMDTDDSYRYVAPRMVTGNTTGGAASCVVLGLPKNLPATDFNLASVQEVETDHD